MAIRDSLPTSAKCARHVHGTFLARLNLPADALQLGTDRIQRAQFRVRPS